MNKSSNFSVKGALQEYLTLMHEVVIRLELASEACYGRLNLTPIYAREFCYLQFRYICELIALGCLQLHGDLPISPKKSKKEWHAEKIMNQLHNEYPYAFPQSVTRQFGEINSIIANSKPNALTREDFEKLYKECGEVLHKGTIKKVNASFLGKEPDYNKVIDWHHKLVNLMNEHLIVRSNKREFFLISLKTEAGYPEGSICTPDLSGNLNIETLKMNLV